MLVKKIYTASDLREEFIAYNRDYYSADGYQAIIDLFEECDCGEPHELDVVAICCDFNEETPEDIIANYDNCLDMDSIKDPETGEIDVNALMDELNYHTWAQLLDNGNIIYQAF